MKTAGWQHDEYGQYGDAEHDAANARAKHADAVLHHAGLHAHGSLETYGVTRVPTTSLVVMPLLVFLLSGVWVRIMWPMNLLSIYSAIFNHFCHFY